MRSRRARLCALLAATAALAGALAPPVHHLAEELLTAHMLQHLALMLVAAPLLAAGRPIVTVLERLPRRTRRSIARLMAQIPGRELFSQPAVVWVTHATVLWAWHVPALYERALTSDVMHATEHATFVLSAVAFWSLLLRERGRQRLGVGGGLIYLFTMAMQGTILGALMTFADRPWYASHAVSQRWLSPLEDQHVAGLIMWIPAGMVYAAAMLALVGSWLTPRPTLPAATRPEAP